MARKFSECFLVAEQEVAVSGDRFMVWQQGIHEEMDAILREIEAG